MCTAAGYDRGRSMTTAAGLGPEPTVLTPQHQHVAGMNCVSEGVRVGDCLICPATWRGSLLMIMHLFGSDHLSVKSYRAIDNILSIGTLWDIYI